MIGYLCRQNLISVVTDAVSGLFYYRVIGPKDADGMANSVDPDQTAPLGAHLMTPLGAVWSGSALFAQTCRYENLQSLRYKSLMVMWLNPAEPSEYRGWFVVMETHWLEQVGFRNRDSIEYWILICHY